MYFVDRKKIEQTLSFLENQIALLKTGLNEEVFTADSFAKASLERISQTMIDSVLDIGNAMIDGFIMRDPGSYDDIIDILEDERVINRDMAISFKEIIPLRKMLVQDYMYLTHKELVEGMKKALPAFEEYPEMIRNYLNTELGPVSAFKSE